MSIKKLKLKIGGMHCSSCSILIDGDLEDLAGVVASKTSYVKSECEIEFDVDRTDLKKIVDTIEKTGYKATPG